MSEKPNDGTVAMHIGEIEDAEYFTAEDYLPTLPNTVSSEHTIVCYGTDWIPSSCVVHSYYLIK